MQHLLKQLPLKHATLGYGYHNQGSNPRLSIKYIGKSAMIHIYNYW
jgi:hypothetical protein